VVCRPERVTSQTPKTDGRELDAMADGVRPTAFEDTLDGLSCQTARWPPRLSSR
jgi:hypothetical protein